MKTLFTLTIIIVFSGSTLFSQNADSSLIAFYPFNGNAVDITGNGHNGTVNGGVLTNDRFNQPENAYTFPNLHDNIVLDNTLTINLENGFTINASVKYKNVNSDIVGKHNCWFVNGFNLGISNGQFWLILANSEWSVIQTNETYNEDQWYMVTGVYDQTNSTGKVYIDGQMKASGTVLYNNFSTAPITISEPSNGCPDGNMPGAIDEVRIYTRVLSDEEIVELYNDSTAYYPQLISSIYPLQNSSYCKSNESIKIVFTEPMDQTTFNYNSISAFGNLTGSYELSLAYQSTENTLDITPTVHFKYGEQITVTLDSSIKSISGYNLFPFTYQFNVKPEKGSVRFAFADSFQINFSPSGILNGDFNNDGKIDVIVSSYDSLKLSVLLGNGLGGFTQGEISSGEYKPYSISATDIDNDRDLDLIISTNEENKIRILRNTGQGTFYWVLPTIDVIAPIATCPGDFDGDGDNDFVAICNNGYAIVYKNDGTGSFISYDTVSTNTASLRNIAGDVDNDGDLDIIGGTSEYSGVFKILKNNGNGSFTFIAGTYLGPYPDELAGGDFNGDFNLDFVKFDWYQNGIGIALNNGLGEYPIEDFLNLGNVGGQTRNPIVSDFDGDGDLDFVGVFNNNYLGIVKNITHPAYEISLSYSIPGIRGIVCGDYDNNGSIDLAGINSISNQIIFLKNCVDSLVAYFPFNNHIQDVSGNLNNGINHSGIYSKDRYGIDASSIYFTGESYIEGNNPGNNLPAGNSPRTFTAWIKENSFHPWGNNIFHYGLDQAAPTNFHFYTTENIRIGNGYDYGVVFGNSVIADSTWHFVSGVYEGGTEHIAKVFVDGKPDGSGVISTEPNTMLVNNWKIGRFMTGSNNFDGNIDELKIYNIALTDQQIWDIYKTTTTAPGLIFPGNDSTLINPPWPNLSLDWDSLVIATSYRVMMSDDSLFSSILLDTISNSSSFTLNATIIPDPDNIYWKVRTINEGGTGPWSEVFNFKMLFTGVQSEDQLPTEYNLYQNYPNPFNPTTTILFALPKTSNVQIKIYDVLGNEIAKLLDEYRNPGSYEINFDGSKLSCGVYFYRIQAGDFVDSKKMILMK